MEECSAENDRIEKIYEKLKTLMQDSLDSGISFVFITQRMLEEELCADSNWKVWQKLFTIKIAFRTSDKFFSKQLIGEKYAEYLIGNRDILCFSDNCLQHLLQYAISKDDIESITGAFDKSN